MKKLLKLLAICAALVMLLPLAQAEMVGQYSDEDKLVAEKGNGNAEYTYNPPKKAWLKGDNGTINLCLPPTDYDVPQAVLFSGLEITLHNTLYKWTAEGMEEWAYISLNVGSDETSLQGWTRAKNLTFEAPEVALPEGKLVSDSVTNMATVFKDNGPASKELGIFPEGSEARLLGMTLDNYYLQVENQRGFIKKDAVYLDTPTQARLKAAEPRTYDDMQPGYEANYEEFDRLYGEMFDIYGDSNTWSLETRARMSQMEMNLKVTPRSDPQSWISILPGEGDITPEEARVRADKALDDKQVDLSTFDQVNEYYYALSGQPEEPIWQFRYNARVGHYDYVVRLDKQGDVTELLKLDLNRYDSMGNELLSQIPHNPVAEKVEGITAQEAISKAWDIFTEAAPELKGREDFYVTGNAYDFEGSTYWLIAFTDKNTPLSYAISGSFEVALNAADGDVLVTTQPYTYQYNLEQFAKHARIMDMQKEKGLFITWTPEDLSAMWPDIYALPKEGDITPEEAISTARALLKEETDVSDQLLDKLETYTLLEGIGDNHRQWMVLYTEKDSFLKPNAVGYIAWVDAATGVATAYYQPKDGSLMMWFYALDGFPLDTLREQTLLNALLSGVPTIPSDKALPKSEAADKAFAEMKKDLPDLDRAQFTEDTRHVMQGLEEYWVSTFTPLAGDVIAPVPTYTVALSEEGNLVIKTDLEDYMKQTEEHDRHLAQEKAQEEKGIFWLWPYDEKPQYDDSRYGLPKEGELREEEAIRIANETLMARYGLSEETLSSWKPMTGLLVDGLRRWEVAYFPLSEGQEQFSQAYFVEIEATTGDVLVAYSPEESNG